MNRWATRAVLRAPADPHFPLAVVAAVVAFALPIERTDPKETVRFIGLLLGGSVMMLVGFLDDWMDLSPLKIYLGQLMAGAISVLFLIFIETFNNPPHGGRWCRAFPTGSR
ncbi:MAG: hypothetical protein HC915_14615 [Anaerolineae bacterium]|nr:hypothetical protein [Anaerolineae bacterium]